MNFFQTILLMLQSGSLCISLENGVSGHLAQDQLIFDNRAPENVKTGKMFEFIRHYEMAKMSLNLESFLAGSRWSLNVREPGFHNQGNLETWAWESGIALTIGISNPSSTVKVPIQFLESGIHSLESTIQYFFEFTYMGPSWRDIVLRLLIYVNQDK